MTKKTGAPIPRDPENPAVRNVRRLAAEGHDVRLVRKDVQKRDYSEETTEDIVESPAGGSEPDLNKELFSERFLRSRDPGREKRSIAYTGPSFGEKLFMLLYSLFFFFFLVWLSIRAEAPPSVVFASFLPVVFTIIASFAFFMHESARYRFAVWVVPLLACAVFYGAALQFPVFSQVEIANVTVLNFLFAMLYVLILDAFGQLDSAFHHEIRARRSSGPAPAAKRTRRRTSRKGRSEDDKSQEIEIAGKEGIKGYLQSIEDKSKAINFVIGRVYSNKHGGSPVLRDKIKINKDWYNMFADVNESNMAMRLPELRDLVFQIGERLNVMWRSERVVFGPGAVKKLKDIDHDAEGNDKIIDVLIRNDKDPVETYYKTAVEFCNRAVAAIDRYEK